MQCKLLFGSKKLLILFTFLVFCFTVLWWNQQLPKDYKQILNQNLYTWREFKQLHFKKLQRPSPEPVLVQASTAAVTLAMETTTAAVDTPLVATEGPPKNSLAVSLKSNLPVPVTQGPTKPIPPVPTTKALSKLKNVPKILPKPTPAPSKPEPPVLATPAPSIQFHQAYAPNYNFIMDHLDACQNPPFLVLMVPVAPKNVAARNAIRQTWAKEPYVHGKRVLTMFMLGQAGEDPQSLTQEDNEHHDLIQSDFVDSYLNLTIKTMVIMHWVSTHCANSTFAMKVDSDMFLNVENLVDMLKLPQIPTINYLTGRVMRDIRVIRAKHSKWYVPEELYPEPKYPLYCLGMGYILSSDLPVRLVEVSKEITPFNIEDAYIGMCMKKLGLSPTAPPQPGQFQAYNSKYDRCRFSQVITYILGSSQQLLQYWDDLKKPDPPCPQ
ncbi:unnamed protein product [Knipowitschia caucasica]